MMIWLTAYLANKMNLTEQQIHQMPFYKVLLYFHAYCVIDGNNTKWSCADAATKKLNDENMNELLDMI